jgi:surface polysaccharide O-acyltransferase-like enzyme
MESTKRNLNIDLLKVLLSFFVIAAHALPTSGKTGIEGYIFYGIQNFARITVPIFFLFSGYFLRNHIHNKVQMIKYGKRIFIMFIVWQLIYYPLLIKFHNIGLVTTTRLIIDTFYGIGHLWYLAATFQALFLLYITRNYNLKLKFIIAFSLLIISYALQMIFDSNLIHNEKWLIQIYQGIGSARNFLFYAFPYMLLGALYENWKILAGKLKWIIIPLFLLLFIEGYICFFKYSLVLNMYFTAIPISLLSLYFALETRKQIQIKANPTLSLGIYLTHFYAVFYMFDKIKSDSFGMIWLKYSIICILTIILWFIINKINKKFPYFF